MTTKDPCTFPLDSEPHKWLGAPIRALVACLMAFILMHAGRADARTRDDNTPPTDNFIQAAQQARHLANEEKWTPALAAADRAYALADGDEYALVEMALLQTWIAEAAGRYGQARGYMRVVLESLADGNGDQLADMQVEAARLAYLDNDRPSGNELLDRSTTSTRTYPGDWIAKGENHALFYRLPGVTLPTFAAEFLRQKVTAADRRNRTSRVRYTDLAPETGDVTLAVHFEFTNYNQPRSASAALARWREGMERRAGENGAMQPLSFDGQSIGLAGSDEVAQAAYIFEDQDLKKRVALLWSARRGPWTLVVGTEWPAARQTEMLERLPDFISAIEWSDPPVEVAENGRNVDVSRELEDAAAWSRQREWSRVQEGAQRASQGAVFPSEHAQSLSLLAMAASARGDDDEAQALIDRAEHYWPWVGLSHYLSVLRDDFLLYTAELAYRRGDEVRGIDSMVELARNSSISRTLIDAQSGAIRDGATGVRLPPRIGGLLRTFERDLAYYVQPGTDVSIEVTLRKASADPESSTSQIAGWMRDRRGARFDDDQIQANAFTSRSGLQGTRLLIPFDTYATSDETDSPDVQDASAVVGEQVMAFWVARSPGSNGQSGEIIVRGKWGRSDQEGRERVEAFAREFPWP